MEAAADLGERARRGADLQEQSAQHRALQLAGLLREEAHNLNRGRNPPQRSNFSTSWQSVCQLFVSCVRRMLLVSASPLCPGGRDECPLAVGATLRRSAAVFGLPTPATLFSFRGLQCGSTETKGQRPEQESGFWDGCMVQMVYKRIPSASIKDAFSVRFDWFNSLLVLRSSCCRVV